MFVSAMDSCRMIHNLPLHVVIICILLKKHCKRPRLINNCDFDGRN
jgi:hypothetical protein